MTSYIKIKKLTKEINGTNVLDNIDLKLSKGKIYGFSDKNDLSKTTLFRIICGLMEPTKGKILIDNKALYKDIEFPPSIGIITQSPGFLPYYTAKENLLIFAQINSVIGNKEVDNALNAVGLDPEDMKMYSQYSLDMKQRLAMAQILMKNPQIILVDEYTNMLDSSTIDILKTQREQGKIILIASNNKKVLKEIADESYEIENGKANILYQI